jgi:hypothetical protein
MALKLDKYWPKTWYDVVSQDIDSSLLITDSIEEEDTTGNSLESCHERSIP